MKRMWPRLVAARDFPAEEAQWSAWSPDRLAVALPGGGMALVDEDGLVTATAVDGSCVWRYSVAPEAAYRDNDWFAQRTTRAGAFPTLAPGGTLALRGARKEVCVLDVATGDVVQSIRWHAGVVIALCPFDGDGLCSADDRGVVAAWRWDAEARRFTLRQHVRTERAVEETTACDLGHGFVMLTGSWWEPAVACNLRAGTFANMPMPPGVRAATVLMPGWVRRQEAVAGRWRGR